MQTTTLRFRQLAAANVRPIAYQLRASFPKNFDDDISFFTLDTSTLNATDVLAPVGGNILAEWDKYDYASYTDRVVQMEWQREEDIPYSVNLAFADITLNNYDDFFTRGSGSPLEPNILPRRPIRLLSGFGNESIPQFVGLTTTVPDVDYGNRTASVHAVDFLSYLFEKPLDQVVVLEDLYTHEVLDYLFELVGLLPDQYSLDTSFNRVKFIFFDKGTKLGKAIRDLMQAELGSLYMDEAGVIRFKNRLNNITASVYTFNKSNTVDMRLSDDSKIINVVEIKANVREVQPTQTIYSLGAPIALNESGTTEVFFSFEDPVTELETISQFTANSLEDGSGSNITGNISVTDTDLFATSVKVTFTNSGIGGYLTDLTLYGAPAKVVKNIYLRAQDDASVDAFEEQVLTIENDFIQTENLADSIALSLLNFYKDYASTVELEVKGTPALQMGDTIAVDDDKSTKDYVITKITSVLGGGQYRQLLVAKIFNIPDFFILDTSVLNGEEVLAI